METAVYSKPLPTISEDGRPFWEGARRSELLLQWCPDCRRHQFPGRVLCSHCGARRVEWRRASGRGRIYSYTVVHRPPEAAFAADVPYIVAVVELEEGPRMMSNIVECDPQAAAIAMPVAAVFEQVSDNVTLVKFRPAAAAD